VKNNHKHLDLTLKNTNQICFKNQISQQESFFSGRFHALSIKISLKFIIQFIAISNAEVKMKL